MQSKLKNVLGEWRITHDDDKKTIIVVENQAQAKFITKNMKGLRIKEWHAINFTE